MMKRYLTIAALCFVGAASPHAADDKEKLQDGDYVAMVGDATGAIYGRPELAPEPYCTYLEAYLVMCKPAQGLSATQFGWPQATALNFAHPLYGGLPNDVMRFRPTVGTLWFGMAESGWAALTPDREKSIRDGLALCTQTMQSNGVHLVALGSPGFIDDTWRGAEEAVKMNKVFEAIRGIARETAERTGAKFADIYGAMADATAKGKARYGATYSLGAGNWPPARAGALLMAGTFLKALGCDGDIGTISVDMAGGTATATDGHKVLSSAKGVVTIESSKYPFCFYGDPAKPEATRSIADVTSFNADLNRFMLVVHKLGADKATVTWGTNACGFTSAELEKGVNLAAAFADGNPFREPFAKVEARILEQQKAETLLSNVLMNRLAAYVHHIPSLKEQTDRLAPAIARKSREERDATAAAVKPVTHTIKIERSK